jgi:Ca2+-binding EF-hand superfamily protein
MIGYGGWAVILLLFALCLCACELHLTQSFVNDNSVEEGSLLQQPCWRAWFAWVRQLLCGLEEEEPYGLLEKGDPFATPREGGTTAVSQSSPLNSLIRGQADSPVKDLERLRYRWSMRDPLAGNPVDTPFRPAPPDLPAPAPVESAPVEAKPLAPSEDFALRRAEEAVQWAKEHDHAPDIMTLFTEMDTDSSGGLDADEFMHALATTGMSADAIRTLFNDCDTDGDGHITLLEFSKSLHKHIELRKLVRPKAIADAHIANVSKPPAAAKPLSSKQMRKNVAESRARNIFAGMDEDANGELTIDEFVRTLQPYGMDEVSIRLVFNECDINGDGKVTVLEVRRAPPTHAVRMV